MTDPGTGLRSAGRWLLGLFRYVSIGALGGWAFWVHLRYRVPGTLLFMLPWLSLGLMSLSVVMLVNHFILGRSPGGPVRRALVRIEYWGSLAILVFCCWSLFLFVNGSRDQFIPSRNRSEVRDVSKRALEINLGSLTPVSWVKLRSWRDPRHDERVLLWDSERDAVWIGRPVIVKVRPGALGIPWVSAIEEDREAYHKAVLAISPTATRSWKELIWFYLREGRPLEAAQAARRYRDLAPNDFRFLTSVSARLGEAGFAGEVITLLEPLAERHPDPILHIFLGAALAHTGQREKGVKTLEEVIARDPEDPRAYYALAEVYEQWGRTAEALATYEKVLRLDSEFLDVPQRVAALRAALAGSAGGVRPRVR